MPFDPASFAISAGTSILGPLVAKGLGSMFGLDEASPEERKAAADREAALQKLRDAAEGKTASAAQLQAQQQQQRTIQALSSMAARGTAQQQAGAQRAAMQAAPEVMAQQGATAAQTRAAEMAAARRDLGAMQLQASQQQAAEGMANRKYMQGLIGAGVSGAAGAGAMAMTQSPDAQKPLETLNEDFTGVGQKAVPALQEYAATMKLPDGTLNVPPPAAAAPAAPAALPAAGSAAPVAASQAAPLALGPPVLPAARSTGGLGMPATGFADGMGVRRRRISLMGGY